MTAGISEDNFGGYDREKYKEMLLDATENVLGIFGFERALFGKSKHKRRWITLRRDKIYDVQAEVDGR